MCNTEQEISQKCCVSSEKWCLYYTICKVLVIERTSHVTQHPLVALEKLNIYEKVYSAVFSLNAKMCVNFSLCLGIVEIKLNKYYTFDKKYILGELQKYVSTFAFSVCRCNIEGEVYGGAVTLWWRAMRAH